MEGSQELSYPLLQPFSLLSISATPGDFNIEFSSNQTPVEFVISVNKYLQLYESHKKINKFRVFFCAFEKFLADIEKWIAFAISRGVEELDLDFSLGYEPYNGFTNGGKSFKLPDFLFHCKSLTYLSLRCCDFNPPSGFTGFPQLWSLSFKDMVVTDDTVTNMLAVCLNLECLRFDNCSTLKRINISAPNLQVKNLTILNCYDAYGILISAPKLQSFIYHGECYFSDVKTPSLVDAFISSLGMESSEPEHDYVKLLYDISHVRILTICTGALMHLTIYDEYINMDLQALPNLQELQLLMACMSIEYLTYIYGFFRLCPSPNVEKLFIQLPKFHENKYRSSTPEPVVEEPSAVTFNHLKVIKMNNFKGCKSEMRLIRFLLEKATVLEVLLLVVPKKPGMEEDNSSSSETHYYVDRREMEMIHGQLVSFPKSSPGAKVVLCEYDEDDQGITPTHTEYFWEYF
ncbi:RNI-like protein [Dioscorea alata]|uniref:RNI-like protein n=1 Tax=Dioscorea alata TaxID=55571 RepID=A0ACB7VP03_DIOAL|nr:RNI-like protein [Dioscorea alata]